MKIVWAGVIFGAGYVLGRPEGRAKLGELMRRPEVAQLRQQAASTVSSTAKSGQHHLTQTAQKVKEAASEKRSGKTGDISDVVTDPSGSRRRLRLPPFPRRAARSDVSAETARGQANSTTATATDDSSSDSGSVNGTSLPTVSPGAPEDLR
jgi:hypothetical protein